MPAEQAEATLESQTEIEPGAGDDVAAPDDAPDPGTQEETQPEEEGTPGEGEGEEKEGGSPSPESPETPGEEPPGSLLVEIGGKEEEIPLPELVRGYQLARKAQEHIKSALALKKAAEEEKRNAETVTEGLLQDHWGTYHRALTAALGGDSDRALQYVIDEAKALVAEYAKFEKLPREQREVIELRRKLAQRDEQLKTERETRAEREQSEGMKLEQAQTLAEITAAMKSVGIRADISRASHRIFVQDVARKLMDFPEMTVQEAVKEIHQEVLNAAEERLKVADDTDPSVVQGLLPKLSEHVRKTNLNGVKRAQSARVSPRDSALRREKPSKPVIVNDGNWDEILRGKR